MTETLWKMGGVMNIFKCHIKDGVDEEWKWHLEKLLEVNT